MELEDYNAMIEKMELDDALKDVKKQIKKTAETHNRNFLAQFLDRTESQMDA